MRILLIIFSLLFAPLPVHARQGLYYVMTGSSAPTGPCPDGNVYIQTGVGTNVCSGGAWVATGGGGGIPAGLITLVLSGTCGAGWNEVAELNGKTLIGTVAANGDVGTTGGSDSVTPTVASLTAAAQAFTGSPLGTHLHGFGTIAAAAHTVVATKQGTGAGNIVTTATHTVSGSTAAITAGTPAGTNGPSAVTGTLNAVDNRSAYLKVIFCVKT